MIGITLCMPLLPASVVNAQPNYAPPSGVYCSCGPTTGVGQGSVAPGIAQLPFVKGILVRVGWQHLEPVDDAYDWSLIDGQIAAANSYGKKISLGIGSGPSTPAWVYTAGAQSLQALAPPSGTLPVPWDSTYLALWTDLVADIGAHYANDTTIQLVYITNSSTNGFEMQLPFNSSPSLTALGYTDALMTGSWELVIDAFAAAFPNHYLTNDFHPVNGSDAVADSIYSYASVVLNGRYGASGWWWTQNNTTVYPAQYALLQNSAANDPFSGIQMAKNGTTDSAAFGAGGMPAALQLAIDQQICYWEIWNQDLLNAAFETTLSAAECADLPTAQVEDPGMHGLHAFPNPAGDHLYLSATWSAGDPYALRSATGVLVSSGILAGSPPQINLGHLPNGTYLLEVEGRGDRLLQRVLLAR